MRKRLRTLTSIWHQENNRSNVASFSFHGEMIAKLERTQRTALQNKDITQNPNNQWEQQKQLISNNRTIALEWTANKVTCSFNYFTAKYSPPDSAIVIRHNSLCSQRFFPTYAMCHIQATTKSINVQ